MSYSHRIAIPDGGEAHRAVSVRLDLRARCSATRALAAAAEQDPVAFRRALLGKSPRARAVLDLAAKEAGWGKPLPPHHGRGVSLMYSGWDTYVAQVADVEVTGAGEVRVKRVVCAVDCGTIINPDIVKAQIESGVV